MPGWTSQPGGPLPPCVAVLGMRSPPGQHHAVRVAWLAAMLACAVAAVLVAAFAAQRLRLLRRGRRSRWQQLDDEPLASFKWAHEHRRPQPSSNGSGSDQAYGRLTRPQRLSALVARRQRRVELQPLQAVTLSTTHSLASHASTELPDSGSASEDGPLLPAGHRLGSEQGGSELSAEQWPLPTDSLRLQPQALEVRPAGGHAPALAGTHTPPPAALTAAAAPVHHPLPQFVADADGSLVVLGMGTFGVVFLAKLEGVPVAVKVCARCALHQAPDGLRAAVTLLPWLDPAASCRLRAHCHAGV